MQRFPIASVLRQVRQAQQQGKLLGRYLSLVLLNNEKK